MTVPNVVDTWWLYELQAGRLSFGGYLCRIQGVTPTWQQQEFVDAIDAGELSISIRSGRGPGKSFIAGQYVVYYILKYDDGIAPVTGVAHEQLKNTFWKEVAAAYRNLPDYVQADYNLTTESLRKKTNYAGNCTYIVTAAKENAENVAGPHSDHLLVLFDEASGVEEEVFTSLLGCLTSAENMHIMLGNPKHLTGTFKESHHELRELYCCLNWNAEESPIVSQGSIDRFALKFGKDSNQYKIHILGEFPTSEEDALIDLEDITACINLDLGDTFGSSISYGVDVGGQGNDPSVICKMRGHTAYEFVEYHKTRGPDLEAHVKIHHGKDKAEAIKIDNVGIGSGVSEHLEDDLPGVAMGVCNAEAAREHKKYKNVRSESLWWLREAFMARTISIPNHPRLIAQLSALCYTIVTGKVFVTPKEKVKKEIGRSPDHADALALALYEPPRHTGPIMM